MRVIKINTLLHQVYYRSNIKYINNHLARDLCDRVLIHAYVRFYYQNYSLNKIHAIERKS